jgi:hypothetical protein
LAESVVKSACNHAYHGCKVIFKYQKVHVAYCREISCGSLSISDHPEKRAQHGVRGNFVIDNNSMRVLTKLSDCYAGESIQWI